MPSFSGIVGATNETRQTEPELDRLKGASWELDQCCLRPWIAAWRLAGSARGRYQLRIGVRSGITGLKEGPAPAELNPLLSDEPGCKAPLNLKVRLSQPGVSLESSLGPECAPADESKKVCFRRTQMEQVRARLYALWSRKYANARWWRNDPYIRGAITVYAGKNMRAQALFDLLDAAREKPEQVETQSSAPCRFVLDPKKRVWVLDEKGKSRCMYPFLTLAIGS